MAFGPNPPDEITLVYRPVGKSHVFTAEGYEMAGFHVSSPVLERAFRLAADSLSLHVSTLYATEAKYEITASFEDFNRHLQGAKMGNFVIAKMAQHQHAQAAHC